MNPTNAPKKKRAGQQAVNETADNAATLTTSPGANGSSAGSSSNFRNVSACNRCRLRKNRCDQKLPACTSCEKANVKCVGFDPVSKREIPRSYVYYLESRVQHLESLLEANDIQFAPADDFTLSVTAKSELDGDSTAKATSAGAGRHDDSLARAPESQEQQDQKKLSNLVHNVGLVSVQGASDARYLGSTSGISFARVVFAAVKSSINGTSSERGGVRPSKPLTGATAAGDTSFRDSFFGLHAKPTIKPSAFPEKTAALALVELYFEHSNPQIPVLHRGEYMDLFNRVYATDEKKRTPRELYFLNIICAIGSGIILDTSDSGQNNTSSYGEHSPESSRKKETSSQRQTQPEEYHSSAILHLESFLGSSPSAEGAGGGLEQLQAVLLLAGFALLRPVAPGLWYIVGVAVRLAVDLGLHNEDPEAVMESTSGQAAEAKAKMNDAELEEYGRREYIRDLRRRLWWCVYSFDRLVSTCVGRPIGITDQVITTEFPTLLDDTYIGSSGFISPPPGVYGTIPSYKHVSYHYFRLRLLQSEILQVLQHRQTQQVRERGVNGSNPWVHVGLTSPFLQKYSSFREWRSDVDRRLWEWIQSSPTQTMAGVAFSPLFLELNYWQTVIMLYRQSLSVPPSLAGELDASTGDDVTSPGHVDEEDEGDEEMVFLKVAEAGQKVLKIYRQLHRVRLVNYTFLSTHHLFMCGISFLYAIWHSVVVRSKLTLDDVDFTVLAATSVLGDLIAKCPPAEACRDAFDRMAKATIAMAMKETGFGRDALQHLPQKPQEPAKSTPPSNRMAPPQGHEDTLDPHLRQFSMQRQKRPAPQFDMDLKALFSDDEFANRPSKTRRAHLQQSAHQPAVKHEPSSGYHNQSSMAPHMSSHTNYRRQQPSPQMYTPGTPLDPSLQMSGQTSSPGQQQNNYFTSIHQQQPYSRPTSETFSYPQTPFESLDFLENFPAAGANSGRMNTTSDDGQGAPAFQDYDIGFGVGGLAFDGGAGPSWDENGGSFDLFDGFFFGGGGGGSGSGGHATG